VIMLGRGVCFCEEAAVRLARHTDRHEVLAEHLPTVPCSQPDGMQGKYEYTAQFLLFKCSLSFPFLRFQIHCVLMLITQKMTVQRHGRTTPVVLGALTEGMSWNNDQKLQAPAKLLKAKSKAIPVTGRGGL
jgi:hypothetical protein